MKILAIETSCDDTSIAILEVKNDSSKILSNIVSSQVKLHAKYGGVVPSLAAREHVKNLDTILKLALKDADLKDISEIDYLAVTKGPGLIPALMVGVAFAQTLSFLSDKPLIGVNHMAGHVYSNWINLKTTRKVFPVLNLIVSGGHTMLVLMTKHNKYELLGETVDDAVGEAFDKVARILELPYPGGPQISKQAEKYDPKDRIGEDIKLPRPMIGSGDFNFSFSGLKTAVLYLVKRLEKKYPISKIGPVVAYEFQEAAIEVLIKKTMKAAEKYNIKTVMLSGGVSANKKLRDTLQDKCAEEKIECIVPDLKYTTDNAAMIAMAAFFSEDKDKGWEHVEADANLKLVN